MSDKPQERRLKVVRISQPLILQMITTGWVSNAPIRCIEGVPPDAVLVDEFIESSFYDASYVFHHDSFDIVPEGERLPYLEVVMSTDYEEA